MGFAPSIVNEFIKSGGSLKIDGSRFAPSIVNEFIKNTGINQRIEFYNMHRFAPSIIKEFIKHSVGKDIIFDIS